MSLLPGIVPSQDRSRFPLGLSFPASFHAVPPGFPLPGSFLVPPWSLPPGIIPGASRVSPSWDRSRFPLGVSLLGSFPVLPGSPIPGIVPGSLPGSQGCVWFVSPGLLRGPAAGPPPGRSRFGEIPLYSSLLAGQRPKSGRTHACHCTLFPVPCLLSPVPSSLLPGEEDATPGTPGGGRAEFGCLPLTPSRSPPGKAKAASPAPVASSPAPSQPGVTHLAVQATIAGQVTGQQALALVTIPTATLAALPGLTPAAPAGAIFKPPVANLTGSQPRGPERDPCLSFPSKESSPRVPV
uniref:Uncharacterized protein n=1 Tax=Junco hyemalis TaxID=40217 RepID=A0A8C5NK21_JUNHY